MKRGTLWRLTPVLWAAVALVPGVAEAGQLSINGVPIGRIELRVQGLENITFEKCTSVKVSPSGDVRIECPGYDLQASLPPQATQTPPPQRPPPAATGHVTKHYWVVSTQTPKAGLTQFDIDLYVNGKWVRRFKNDETQYVGDISPYLVPGKNELIFAATKETTGTRLSTNPADQFKIIIGEGERVGLNLRITQVLAVSTRTAAEPDNRNDQVEVTAN